jgi:hypothetical protein
MGKTVVTTHRLGIEGGVLINSTTGTAYVTENIRVGSSLDVLTPRGVYIAESSDTESAGVPVVGGGVLYVNEGKLKYRGSTGTITTVADA